LLEDGEARATLSVAEIDPSWINLDTIHTWMQHCKDSHQCLNRPSFGKGPTWLINVEKECLVSGASLLDGARYCALSYVWGQVETTKLTVGSEEAYQQPGVFSLANEQAIIIPKTIRHAMGLVVLLGIKYLWVDALCIVQDDKTHFHTELRNMGAIYDRAYLTIVAGTGWDANEGLRGLEGLTPRRRLALNFADDLHKYSNPGFMFWVGGPHATTNSNLLCPKLLTVSSHAH
jgi:hypothetical protein